MQGGNEVSGDWVFRRRSWSWCVQHRSKTTARNLPLLIPQQTDNTDNISTPQTAVEKRQYRKRRAKVSKG